MTSTHTRLAVPFIALVVTAVCQLGCSSGLGNNLPPSTPTGGSAPNANVQTGLDLGIEVSESLVSRIVTGAVVPGIGGGEARELLLVTFATATPGDNADGAGSRLARDGSTTDSNAALDLFTAAVVASEIDDTAFSQRLAGKFRHPRCATCHGMQVENTLSFASSLMIHAGPPTGPMFPANDPAMCADCHVSSTSFPVEGWQAPAASFDMRSKSVAELAVMAQNVPADELEHFTTDKRVLWALDSGILPIVGGRNGIADDDHDGILEPEDDDGRIRIVPGGSAEFLDDIERWNEGGNKVTTADAVVDIELVSQRVGGGSSADGASTAPVAIYVANPTFDPTSAITAAATNPIGRLYIAFQSDATNLVTADTNGMTDVFRSTLELRAEEDATGASSPGAISLQWTNATVAASAPSGSGGTVTGGPSSSPSIGGADGEFVAFESVASDLVAGFVDQNGAAEPDIFRRQIGGGGQTSLVSRTVASSTTGGSGRSTEAAISSDGLVIAFSSEAADLVADDTNAVQDVFYATDLGGADYVVSRASVASGLRQGSGGASGNPTVCADSGRILVAFESAKTDLVDTIDAAATTNVYLFDSAGLGTTSLLNQRRAPDTAAATESSSVIAFGTTSTAPVGIPGNGSARNPVIAADGSAVAFETDADNLDVLRSRDENKSTDVVIVELGPLQNDGFVLPFRQSIAGTGDEGDGDSTAPSFGSFAGASASFTTGFLLFDTTATNLGTSDTTPWILGFLNEKSGVLADFDVDVTSGAAPLTVEFTDRSSGSPTSWAWDFDGDDVTDSTEQNPTFVYTTPGTFSVRLIATNESGTSGRAMQTDLIRAFGPVVAGFEPSVTLGLRPLAVTYTDTSTEAPTSWEWDLDGDGTTDSTEQNPTTTYTDLGPVTVRLTATGAGGQDTVTRASVVEVFDPVVADFSADATSGMAPLTVTFADLSTGSPTSWAWDFDGDSVIDSTEQNPVFEYPSPGNFDVTLTASHPASSDVETKMTFIATGGAIVAGFTSSVTGGVAPLMVNFTDTSTGSPTSWEWFFDFTNDMTVDATTQDTSFTFTTPGVYTVRLVATGPGASDDVTQMITVVEQMTTDLSPAKDNTLYEDNVDDPSMVSNGAGIHLFAGAARTESDTNTPANLLLRRAALEFDLSSIPAGSTIDSVELRLTMNAIAMDAATPPTQAFRLHRITQEWGEGSSVGVGEQGAGGPAAAGDATWTHAISPNFPTTTGGTPWTSDGGDFGAARGSTNVGNTLQDYTWSTSSTLVDDVQDWLDDATTNHGWMILGPESTRSARRFASRETPNSSERPRLRITFTPPF